MLGGLVERLRGRPRLPVHVDLVSIPIKAPEPTKSSGPKPELINPTYHPLGRNVEFHLYAGRWNTYAESEKRLSFQKQVEDAKKALEKRRLDENLGAIILQRLVTMREMDRDKQLDYRESREFKDARRKLRTARDQLDRAREKSQRAIRPFEEALSLAHYSLESLDQQFALRLKTLQELAFYIVDKMPQDPIGKENLIARFVTKPGFRFDPAQLTHVNSLIFDLDRQYPDRDNHWTFGDRLKREKERLVRTNSARQTEVIRRIVRSRLVGTLLAHSQKQS